MSSRADVEGYRRHPSEPMLRREKEAQLVARERIDVTLPGRRLPAGHLHPITLLRERIEDIFVSMGYTIEDGPEDRD